MRKSFILLSIILTLMYAGASAQTLTIRPFKLNAKQVLSKSSVYQENFSYSEYSLERNELNKITKNIKPETTVITCCASGMRSSAAKSQLKAMGFSNVFNGGGWYSLNNKIRS